MTTVPLPGDALPNGAVAIAVKESGPVLVVLAINNPCTPRAEFVTWLGDHVAGHGLTLYSGRYFRTIGEAVTDYTGRG